MPEAHVHPAHHFDSLEHQSHAATLGMWVFLASEVLLFAGMFALYGGYRAVYPEGFAEGVSHNLGWLGTLNTGILLLSSYTMARGAHALPHGNPRLAAKLLYATVGFGVLFLLLKSYEYAQHFHEGIFPGGRGHFFAEHTTSGLPMFFNLYYLMTGIHAIHVIVGLGVVLTFGLRTGLGHIPAEKGYQLELVAMYWHLVDLVWIFLWPLYYLTSGRGA